MNDSLHSENRHPFYELLVLVFFCFFAGLIFSLAGIAVYQFSIGSPSLGNLLVDIPSEHNLSFIRIVQTFSSLGIFIAGPLSYAFFRRYNINKYYCFSSTVNPYLVFLTAAILFSSLPLIEMLTSWNAKMALPESLKSIEIWMKSKEEEALLLTRQLLTMNGYGDLFINLFIVAIIPAIGEELFFRGGMQQIFLKWFKNPHIAIWTTAIIFSAIHVQFYGFIPRVFLGALFGYLLFWGKNLWYPIIGHFINNGSAVIMAFVYQQKGKSLEEIEKMDNFPVYGYIFSALFTLVLLYNFYQKRKKIYE